MEATSRKLETTDAQSYKELRLRAFQESPRAFSSSVDDESDKPIEFFLEAMGHDPEHFTLGAFTAVSRLVAFATFRRDQRSKARHKSYLSTMYVAPEARGQGVGRALLAQ